MMLDLIPPFLISLAIGFLFVSLLWPVGPGFHTHLWLKLSLAFGVGHGITSCLFFLWLLLYGQTDRKYIAIEIITLAGLFAGFLMRNRKERAMRPEVPSFTGSLRLRYGWLFPMAFYVALCATILTAIAGILRDPHGSWDAWAIFGLRARAIFRGGVYWQDGFSSLISWTHPDYPLLLPLSTARIWLYCGREVVSAQAILSALFTLATVGLLCSALATLRSRAQGFLAGIVLLGFTGFVVLGSSGLADLPLMFYFTATFALFALQHSLGVVNYRFLILAGVTAGLAAWTKNEGMLFIMTSAAAHMLVTVSAKGRRAYLKELLFISFGLLPVLAVVLYFKMRLAPPSELIAGMSSQSTIRKLLDYHRYSYIAQEFLRRVIYYSPRGANIFLLAIYLFCVRATLKYRSSILQLGLILCLMLGGYFWVYLTTPHDLAFHVTFSLDRLLLHLWPGFLLLYFLTALTPEETFAGGERSHA